MSNFRQNTELQKEIARNGITAGTPLFNPEAFGLDPLPRKIYDGNYNKAEALWICRHALEQQQWDVYLAFYRIGPATDYDVAKYLAIERTNICGRRNTLMQYGLIEKYDIIHVERGHKTVQNIRWRAVIRIPDHEKFRKEIERN